MIIQVASKKKKKQALWSSPAPWMKFAKCSPLYSVRCSTQNSFKFVNDKNFAGNTLSNTLKHLIFIFIFIFNHEELYINQEITK